MAIQNIFGSKGETFLDQSAGKVGDHLAKTEKQAMKAFSLSEKDTTQVRALAKELGMPDPSKATLEGIQLFAKRALDKAQTAYQLLVNLFQGKKQTMDAVVNNIGR